MTVAFLTSRHIPEDDRIFHHMAVTLVRADHTVVVISSRGEAGGEKRGVLFHSFNGTHSSRQVRQQRFLQFLHETDPRLIICADPFAVHTAHKYKKQSRKVVRILYDVTEWYPSKKELSRHTLPVRILLFPGYLLYNLRAGAWADAFLFGEWYKSRPFRFLFPRKKHLFLSYYPALTHIPYTPAVHPEEVLHLSYSGKLSREKGFQHFLEVMALLGTKRPQLQISVTVVGEHENDREKKEAERKMAEMPENVRFTFFPFLDYHSYLEKISTTDIYMDLRRRDPENQRCLPIRLFYAAAFGRPVVYSDLKAIRKEVEVDPFGFLVDPGDTAPVTAILEKYLDDTALYLRHAGNARRLAEERYNWQALQEDFISFCNQTADA
jgi:glycosyltransferase involved in cell wall biosynthesis